MKKLSSGLAFAFGTLVVMVVAKGGIMTTADCIDNPGTGCGTCVVEFYLGSCYATQCAPGPAYKACVLGKGDTCVQKGTSAVTCTGCRDTPPVAPNAGAGCSVDGPCILVGPSYTYTSPATCF